MSNSPELTDQTNTGRLVAYLYGGLFVLLGLGAIIWLAVTIISDPAVNQVLGGSGAESEAAPSLIMAFLTQFGMILPVVVFGLGVISIWLGVRLSTQNIVVARWAQSALLWLTVGAGIAIGFNLIQLGVSYFLARNAQEAAIDPEQLFTLPALFGAVVFFGAALYGLNRRIEHDFVGKEQLNSQQVRNAWNLLIPTLAIFVLVAARPLEQTMIRSLTDKRFAGQEVPAFVGLDNYQNLLSARLDMVDCRLDEATNACDLARDGSIRWQTIDRDLLKEGFRTVWAIPSRCPTHRRLWPLVAWMRISSKVLALPCFLPSFQ